MFRVSLFIGRSFPAPLAPVLKCRGSAEFDASDHVILRLSKDGHEITATGTRGLASNFALNCALPNPIPDPTGATQIVQNGGPAAAVQAEYTYGPDGKLVWDSHTGDYLWDGDDLIKTTTGNYSVLIDHDAVYTGANAYGYAPITYQLRDPSEALVSVSPGTTPEACLPGDAFLTNHCGNSEDLYYPQGLPQAAGSYTIMSPFQRADGIWDGWNNIQGARAYDPSVGQWTAPDAYQGDVHDPASQRPYMYNDNNPYLYQDPSGYDPTPVDIRNSVNDIVYRKLMLTNGDIDAALPMIKAAVNEQFASLGNGKYQVDFKNEAGGAGNRGQATLMSRNGAIKIYKSDGHNGQGGLRVESRTVAGSGYKPGIRIGDGDRFSFENGVVYQSSARWGSVRFPYVPTGMRAGSAEEEEY